MRWTTTSENFEQLGESWDLEAKKAAGRDGKGELPSSFFESYSAMANTDGGLIILGLEEDAAGQLSAHGIVNISRVQRELWNGLNNRQKVSVNLLSRGAEARPRDRCAGGTGDTRACAEHEHHPSARYYGGSRLARAARDAGKHREAQRYEVLFPG